MSISNLVNGEHATGGEGKKSVNRIIARLVKKHFGAVFWPRMCLALVGTGKENFKRHIHEHTVDLSCNNKLVYVDNNPITVKNLRQNRKQYPKLDIEIVEGDMKDEVERRALAGERINVLDHDGVLPFSQIEVDTLTLAASTGCEIMICTVPTRNNIKNDNFLNAAWDRYNGQQKECNASGCQGYSGIEWNPRVCIKPHYKSHRMAKPVGSIQAFAMKELADSLGYKFISLPYKGGKRNGSPMMVGLFLKQ